MTNRIAEITARCDECRPIRRIDVKYLLSQLAERDKEIERLHRFKEYFDELYGQGLEVANWHLNGNTEPFDSFYDSAVEYMNDPLPAAPEEGAGK